MEVHSVTQVMDLKSQYSPTSGFFLFIEGEKGIPGRSVDSEWP